MSPSFNAAGAIHGETVALAPSAARTANGDGPAFPLAERSTVRLKLDVTAAAGTSPSLTVNIQHSADGTSWTTHSSFAAKTAAGSERKVFGALDAFVRASWAITGTHALVHLLRHRGSRLIRRFSWPV